jgi:hypothetical protein
MPPGSPEYRLFLKEDKIEQRTFQTKPLLALIKDKLIA